MTSDQKARKNEDWLLANQGTIHFIYLSANISFAVIILGNVLMYATVSVELEPFGLAMTCVVLLWVAISGMMRLQLSHIATIKRYRAMLQETSAPSSE